jgi:hypothetical protein
MPAEEGRGIVIDEIRSVLRVIEKMLSSLHGTDADPKV